MNNKTAIIVTRIICVSVAVSVGCWASMSAWPLFGLVLIVLCDSKVDDKQ